MFGCDATQGIVSVDADNAGRARVWQRTGVRVEASEHRFPNWFLTTSLDLDTFKNLVDRNDGNAVQLP